MRISNITEHIPVRSEKCSTPENSETSKIKILNILLRDFNGLFWVRGPAGGQDGRTHAHPSTSKATSALVSTSTSNSEIIFFAAYPTTDAYN